MSHDIEDIITVLDSRNDFEQMDKAPDSVKRYLRDEFSNILNDEQFLESISGYIGYAQTSAGRAMRIVEFMKEYCGIK